MSTAVTVAVPVRDRREQMVRCLTALLALDHPDYEILVLDNESSDGTADACRELASGAGVPVRVVTVPGAVGRVRNRARELAGGDVIAFTDSDCMPTARWLAEALPLFEADPGLGVVQGPTRPEPGAAREAWAVTQELPEWTGRYEACNLFVRREALATTTGFDELVFFGEDTAAGAAIRRAGWGAAFAPGALVHHDVTHPGFTYWVRRGLKYGNFARILRQYPELREELLWHRWFLRPRSLKTVGLALALVLGRRQRIALLLALPWLIERAPRRRNPVAATYRLTQTALFDLSVLAGTLVGSVRHRSPLL